MASTTTTLCLSRITIILDPLQTGFRSGHSTQTCLLKLTDNIRLGIETQHVTLLLLFDFSKAFDSVYHVRLLKKLLDYGSKLAIHWIASYLIDRKQSVVDGVGNYSTYLNLNTGVRQGSVLRPLLFSIDVNDISLCLDHDISQLMYADDLQIYIRCPLGELDRVFSIMSANTLHIMNWASQNHLRLNVGKTKAIGIGSSYYINRLSAMARNYIDIGGDRIFFESSLRFLGVILDSKLSWKDHIAQTSRRVRYLMYRLYHFRKSTKPQAT